TSPSSLIRASISASLGSRSGAGVLTYSSRGNPADKRYSSCSPETCCPGATHGIDEVVVRGLACLGVIGWPFEVELRLTVVVPDARISVPARLSGRQGAALRRSPQSRSAHLTIFNYGSYPGRGRAWPGSRRGDRACTASAGAGFSP